MYKQVRINSDISTSFNSAQNQGQIYSFTIPSNLGFVDLNNSYIEFENCTLDDANAEAINAYSNLYLPYGMESLISMSQLKNGLGLVEQIQDVNVLHCNKSVYTYDMEDQQQLAKYGRGLFYDDTQGNRTINPNANMVGLQRQSLFYEIFENAANLPSLIRRQANPKCFLKNILGCAKSKELYASALLGDTTISIQMADPKQRQVIYNAGYDLLNYSTTPFIAGAVAGAAAPFITTSNTAAYHTNTLFNTPFLVDQLVYTGNAAGTAISDVLGCPPARIDQLDTTAGGSLEVTPSANFAGGTNVQSMFFQNQPDDYSYRFTKCYLVLNTVQYDPVKTRELLNDYKFPYRTYSLEVTQIYPSSSQFDHRWILEPATTNCYLMNLGYTPITSPVTGATVNYPSMISTIDTLKSYRWYVNNIDVTYFDIHIPSSNADAATNQPATNLYPDPLHYDLLIRTFNNGSDKLKNLQYYTAGEPIYYTLTQANNMSSRLLQAVPIPLSDQQQTLRIRMISQGSAYPAITGFTDRPSYLFKEKLNLFLIKDGKIVRA